MAGTLRKTMEYLGLAETDDYALGEVDRGRSRGAVRFDAHASRADRAAHDGYEAEDGDHVAGEWDAVDSDDFGRPDHDRDGADVDEHHDHPSEVGALADRRSGYGRVTPLHPHVGSAVRPVAQRAPAPAPEVPELRRITTIHPRTYNEAKSIGESFRGGIPVIMNLTDMSDADAKRLVDFSAGLVFGLRGSIERVTNKVFLLSPEHVTVTGDAPVVRPPHLFNQS